MRVSYPIRTASKLTSIAPDTLRAWERRYKAIEPEREGRSRAYKQEHIQRLLLLRDAIGYGHSIGKIASLNDAELRELLLTDSNAGKQNVEHYFPAAKSSPILQLILAAIESFKPALANEELTRLSLMLPPPEMVHKVVLPLMRIAGERCYRGSWSIAHEHLISGILRNLMGTLIRLNQPRGTLARLVAATPAGELHEFGILAAAILAASRGLEVIYLGPNLPARELVFTAERTEADAVLLGLTSNNSESLIREDLEWLARQMPTRVEIWLGGSLDVERQPPWNPRFLLIGDFISLEAHLERLKNGGRQPILNE
jgi:MerR family transcriptional regulator, light-induced transcriptional regulator